MKSIRDLIFWQYAKIIAESAGIGKGNYGFIMSRFKKLQAGDIHWSSTIREWIGEHENPNTCIYCEKEIPALTTEHILPRHRGGPDIPDNAVRVCKSCNSQKGAKRLYEWFGWDQRDDVPRIAEGKYLKLLYALHEARGTLEASDVSSLCPQCDLGFLCPEKAKLSVYCLEGIFTPRE
ncbi:MAG TPA: HNH endonuclease [Candidatus Lokiarchaeia archaeon]|nr:HNH endonuclease [Candidatus Lokiarchaeia archaeon]